MHSLLKGIGFWLGVTASLMIAVASVSAESVSSFDEMYSSLPGAGRVNHSVAVERALKIVEKNQLLRERRIVKIKGPRDVHIINHRFISLSFNATIKKQGKARQKASPAVYAILFEKNKANALTFYKSIYLTWVGAKDIEEYKNIKLSKICGYYRSKGAEYVIPDKKMVVRKVKKTTAPTVNASYIKSGTLDEQYIDGAITRDAELEIVLESYMKKDPSQQAADPDTGRRISQLEARIKRLESLLINVTRKGSNLYFQKVNVHIENGTGNADKSNGTGNLIVGYGSSGSGSHNIAVGKNNAFSSVGGIVSGNQNSIEKKYASVIGGERNKASGTSAVIAGGHDNRASGDHSSILGGSDNKSQGKYTSINGQRGRTKVDAGKNKHFKN